MQRLFMNTIWLVAVTLVIAMTFLFRPDSENFIGAFESTDRILVTEVSGLVAQVFVVPGQQVAKGQPLIELSDINLDIMINETEHSIKRLKLERKLARGMMENHSSTTQSPMDVEIEQMERDLRLKQKKRNALRIDALQDGFIGTLQVVVGQQVAAFQTLGTFYSTGTRVIHGFLHETAVSRLHVGDQVFIQSATNPLKASVAQVVGIGQRYTSFPERLTPATATQKMWGQEVDVIVPETHPFLPSEKVNITVQGRGFSYFKKALVVALGSH